MTNAIEQTGPVTLYISHGAGDRLTGTVDWFIVEPRDDAEQLIREIKRLKRTGRTVKAIRVAPYEGRTG